MVDSATLDDILDAWAEFVVDSGHAVEGEARRVHADAERYPDRVGQGHLAAKALLHLLLLAGRLRSSASLLLI